MISTRRRRRLRWIVYPFLGFVAVLFITGAVLLRSERLERALQGRLADALSRTLGHPVTVDRVSLRLMPPGAVVEGIRSEGPLVSIARAEATLSVRGLLRGRITIRDVSVSQPVVRWDVDAGKLLAGERREPGALSQKIDLRRLNVTDGTLLVGSEAHLFSAEMEGLSVTAGNGGGTRGARGYKGPWTGSASFEHGKVSFHDLALEGVAGSVAFEAGPDDVSLRRMSLRAEGVRVRGDGRLRPGDPPHFEATVEGTVDPASPALARPLPQFGAAGATLQAVIAYDGEGTTTVEGTFELETPDIDIDRTETSDGESRPWVGRTASGTFLASGSSLSVSASVTDIAGGSITGDYASTPTGEGKPDRARVTVDAERLRLSDLLSRLRLPGDPDVTPSARVSGHASMQWDAGGFDSVTGSAHLDLAPGAGTPPLSGVVDLSWRGKTLRFESSTLDIPGSRLALTGGLDLTGEDTRLDLSLGLASTDVTPLALLVRDRFASSFAAPPGADRPRLLPTDLTGAMDATLTVRGTSGAPDVQAGFYTSGATLSIPPLAGEDPGRITLALTRADGRLAYSPSRLDLQLSKAEGEGLEAVFGLALDPSNGDLLSLRADAARLPAELLGTLAGLDAGRLGMSGSTHATLDLHPGAGGAGLEGPVRLGADRATMAGLDLTDVTAEGRLVGGALLLDTASVRLFGGQVTGSGRVPLSTAPGTETGNIGLRASGIDLAAVDARFEGPSLSGTLDAEGTIAVGATTGLDGTLRGDAIEIAGMRLGVVTGSVSGSLDRPRLTIRDAGGTLSATTTVTFAAGGEDADAPPGDSLPWIDLTLEARALSLETARPLLPAGALPGLIGSADGTVTAEGPLLHPEDLVVKAVMDRLTLTVGEVPVRNEEPVRITLQDGFLTLAPTRLVGDKVDLTLAGSMVVGGSYDVTARLQGTYDLGLIQLILPEMRASGPGTVDLQVVQRAEKLTYRGTITLDGGRVSDPALPQPLEQVRGRGEFTEEGRLVIDSLRFMTGGGTVTGSGWTRFEGAAMPSMHLAMHGSGIRAEILPEFRAFFDADVSIDKVAEELKVGGRIHVLRGIYSRSFGLEPADLMLRGRQYGPGTRPEEGPPVVLDLKIVADGGVWVRNKDARIETSADLLLAGTVAEPELSGRISAIEGGLFRFRDVTYTIIGGALDFTDVTRIDPLLNIEAATRVQTYEVTLHVSGRFSKPVFDLTSEPPLPQRDIVLLLLTGRVPSEPGNAATRGFAEGQVATYLAAPVTGVVSAPLEKVLGVSSLQIDPYFLNGTTDPSARLTITKQVTPNLMLTYSSSLGQSGQEVYQIEYNPGRIWDVLATRNFDGSIGTDLRFRRRWLGAKSATAAPQGEEAPQVRLGRITLVADHLPEKGDRILRGLDLDEGDPYRRGDLLEGREELRLYYARRGYPLAQVDMAEDEPAGEDPSRVNVTYAVRSGPRYDVTVAGGASPRSIRKAVKRAWSEPIMLEDLVDEAGNAARSYLVNKGHYSADVTPEETTGASGTHEVDLTIDPGPKVHVRSITIKGNEALAEDLIRKQILTKESRTLNPFRRGILRRKVLQDDADSIRGLYLAHGYLSAKVPEPEVTLTPDGTEADVTITIEEGPQWLVGSVAIEGEAEDVPSELLLEKSALKASQVVTTTAISEASDRVRAALDKHGYWKSRVSSHLEGEPQTSRVVLTIVPGERARVRNVTIEGNTRTQTRLVKKEITLEEGEELSRSSMLQTQRNLYGLGVFRSVEVDPEPVEGEPGLTDVKVRLQEGSPLLTAWGVGYDTESRARASFELGHNNLFGTRRSAGLFVRESSVDRRLQLTLRDPNLFAKNIESLWSGFFEKREFDSYDERRRGASMQLSRKFGEKTTVFGRYLLEDIDIYNLQVSISEARIQTARLGSFGLSAAYDSRDDIINPTRGGFNTIDARLYHHVLGSQEEFWRLFGAASRYKDIGRNVIWASSVRAGILTSADIPISERFFAGGDTTLRGFAFNTVGPEDPDTGNPVGGQGLLLLNTELRFPIYSALRGVVFYDAGNVYATPSDYDPTDLRHVGGLGLRFDTPVGPFRVEYGWKLDREPGESPGQFFFSIGQAF